MLPQKYEPGNHNLVGLAGLAAATDFLRAETIEAIEAHHARLGRQLIDGFSEIEGVTLYGPTSMTADRTSVVSITVEGYDPQELAAILEQTHNLQCRAGFQCAPRMHESLGTVPLRRHPPLQPRPHDNARRNRQCDHRRSQEVAVAAVT